MNWLDKHQEKILFFTWTLIILTCLFVIFTSPVKASSPNGLPYYVNQNAPYDLPFSYSEVVSDFFTRYSALGNTNLTESDLLNCKNYICVPTYNNSTLTTFTFYILIDGDYVLSLSNSNYDSFDYTVDYVTITQYGYGSNLGKAVSISANMNWETGLWNASGYGYNNNDTIRVFYGHNSPIYYPFAIKDTYSYGVDELPVLANYTGPIDYSGHASPPVDENGHYIDDGSGNRIPKPNFPQITGHTPSAPQFPNIDTSSIESLLESLIDVVEYSISYVVGVISDTFSNLLSNLSSLFNFVVQSFYYAVNNIVGSIKDFASTLYNNFASLFENVSTFYNTCVALGTDENGIFSLQTFLTALIFPDTDALSGLLTDSDVFGVIPFVSSVRLAITNILDTLSNLTPTKVFILPSFTWHGTIYNLVMDFSWYDDYKIYGDTIISGFLILFYLHWVYINISNTLRGAHSIGHDLSKGGD